MTKKNRELFQETLRGSGLLFEYAPNYMSDKVEIETQSFKDVVRFLNEYTSVVNRPFQASEDKITMNEKKSFV